MIYPMDVYVDCRDSESLQYALKMAESMGYSKPNWVSTFSFCATYIFLYAHNEEHIPVYAIYPADRVHLIIHDKTEVLYEVFMDTNSIFKEL